MMPQRLATVIAVFFLFATGCAKEDLKKGDCEKLRQGIVAADKEQVRNEINAFIAGLPSDTNSQENLQKLAQAISSQCDVTATVLCFGCIKTLPEQSEIRISFSSSGSVISRTIDISYTEENKMIFVNLHE